MVAWHTKAHSERQRPTFREQVLELMRLMGAELKLSTAFHPQTDDQTERTNRTMLELLRPHIDHQQDDWDEWLNAVEFAYNDTEQDSIRMMSFYCGLGRHTNTPNILATQQNAHELTNVDAAAGLAERLQAITAEAQAAMGEVQRMQEHYADQRRRAETFKVGNRALVFTGYTRTEAGRTRPSRKLAPRYSGPYTIKEKFSDVIYVLDLPDTMKMHPTFHISRLKRHHDRPGVIASAEQRSS
jgi:hypothetical protein